MSAAELIEQIKALPPSEQEMVREFLVNGEDSPPAAGARYASDRKLEEAADRVFEKHEDLLRKLAQ